MPPDDYGAYAYSGIMEIARGVELAKSTDRDAVADTLRATTTYDHYKGKQWWRKCDNKAFQDLWILKGRGPGKLKGEWGVLDVVVARSRPTRSSTGPAPRRDSPRDFGGVGSPPMPLLLRSERARRHGVGARCPGLHGPRPGGHLRPARHRPEPDLRADDGGELRPRLALHAGGVLRVLPPRPHQNFWVSLVLAPLMVVVLGLVIERFLVRPLYGRGPDDPAAADLRAVAGHGRGREGSSGARSGSPSTRRTRWPAPSTSAS